MDQPNTIFHFAYYRRTDKSVQHILILAFLGIIHFKSQERLKRVPTNDIVIELYSQIILEKKPPIAKITLNRPEALNALGFELLKELDSALNEVCEDKSVRVLVITGAGRAFCAGADLKFMSKQESPTQLLDYLQMLDDVFLRLENFGKPVIASVNGYTLAGGLELMLCCDLAVASDQAIIGDEHINRALMPGGGSSIRLPRIIGLRKAKELLYTGDRWKADQALQFGLVNKVVAHDKLEETVIELANKLATKSPQALKILKQVVNNSCLVDTRTAQILERIAFNAVFTTKEAQNGLQSFLSKM